MAQKPNSKRAPRDQGLTRGEWIAAGLCVLWMLVAALFFWLLPPNQAVSGQTDSLRWVLVFVAIFMPAGLIWVAMVTSRAVRLMREESFRIQTALDDLRQMQLAQAAMQGRAEPVVERKLDEIAETAKNTQAAVSGFASRRAVSRLIVPRAAPQAPADQPTLAFDTPTEDADPPLDRADLIRGLHFPNDENDAEGFAALRRALRDRKARRLVQSSQDVLTLLAQEGIYTDDMHPAPVPAALWRAFAKGERGKSVDRLGAIDDRILLARTATRMREDMIFRDAVHHFLRLFDDMLILFTQNATDTDLLALAETRTARAFMLLARSTGTFD